jgi:hypothetical protein
VPRIRPQLATLARRPLTAPARDRGKAPNPALLHTVQPFENPLPAARTTVAVTRPWQGSFVLCAAPDNRETAREAPSARVGGGRGTSAAQGGSVHRDHGLRRVHHPHPIDPGPVEVARAGPARLRCRRVRPGSQRSRQGQPAATAGGTVFGTTHRAGGPSDSDEAGNLDAPPG